MLMSPKYRRLEDYFYMYSLLICQLYVLRHNYVQPGHWGTMNLIAN